MSVKIANPIAAMMAEHENEGERYVRISELTNNYQVPADGCTTYEVTLKQLADLEKNLHRHIQLKYPLKIEFFSRVVHILFQTVGWIGFNLQNGNGACNKEAYYFNNQIKNGLQSGAGFFHYFPFFCTFNQSNK